MSQQNVERFLEQAEQDAAVRSRLIEARQESIRTVAAELGYTFSIEELRAVLQKKAGELDLAELDQVAGGMAGPGAYVQGGSLGQGLGSLGGLGLS